VRSSRSFELTGSEERVLYADASALVKLVVEERESEALAGWLEKHRVSLLVSSLGRIEVARTIRLLDDSPSMREKVNELFGNVNVFALTTAVRVRAEEVRPLALRSLDAVHLATALEADVLEMLVYDRRLAEAAGANGIAILSPGS
jgi:predicted nucleic acid-binding protein